MVKYEPAPDIKVAIDDLISKLKMTHIKADYVKCMRSYESKSRAYAHIWSMSRILQLALDIKPHYIIEVLSEKFDKLSQEDKTKVLIHELLHIPKSFSGALVNHNCFGNKVINNDKINQLYKEYNLKDLSDFY